MSIYLVDEHRTVHTCPADPNPHAIDIRHTIVHITPGRPCEHPITIRSADRTVTIPCREHEPAHRQCPPCRTVIVTRTVTEVTA